MNATAEVRWFYAGDVPEAADVWLEALPGQPSEAARTDRYLRPTDAALGVKLREGQLEIKRRDAPGDPCQFHPRVTGRVERWRKWSFDAGERTSDVPPWTSVAGAALWVDVAKTRRKIRYRVEPDGQVVAYAGEAAPENGCDLELTRVAVADVRWWSVCLEAFGDERALRDTLLQTARYVFETSVPPSLDEAHSKGYAAWLLALSDQLSAPNQRANS